MPKTTKLFWMLPYCFAVWMGKPYRKDSYGIHQKWEYYIGRFFCFLGVIFGLFIFLMFLTHQTFATVMVLGILAAITASFDFVVYACRALFVYEAVKRMPEGGNPLTIWNDKSLWEDD